MSDFLRYLEDQGYFRPLVLKSAIPLKDSNSWLTKSTTVVGVAYKDGAVLCADSQVTGGDSNRLYEPAMKIALVPPYGAVGAAGLAGIALEILRIFPIVVSAETCVNGRLPTPEACANILRMLAAQTFNLVLMSDGKIYQMFLFAAYDPNPNRECRGRIFLTDSTGLLQDHPRVGYAAIGAGHASANHALRDAEYAWDTATYRDALRAGLKALARAAEDNVGTGPPFFAAHVSADGARMIPEAEIAQALSPS